MSTNTLTFDESPPRRPGLDDVGGGQKVNDGGTPDPVRDPTAEDANQTALQLVALGKVMPVALLSVANSGAPALDRQSCAPTAPSLLTFTVTDNGVGDTSITWPAGTFPAPVAKPRAYVTGATPALIAAEAITNGVRVRTRDAAGAPVDVPFDVDVY